MGKGVKGGQGSGGGGVCYLWYSIWFLGQDVNWDIVLSPAPVAVLSFFLNFILLCFSLSNVFYVYGVVNYFISGINHTPKQKKTKITGDKKLTSTSCTVKVYCY